MFEGKPEVALHYCISCGSAYQVNTVKFNFESTMLFSASVDGTCKAWDLRSRSYDPTQTLNEAKDNVTSLFITASQILTGSADCCIRRYVVVIDAGGVV